uniref:Uncharacterized protein n=1 Tax=Anguilla anguilla TaxID=7936 RepID=A0A0E9UHM3_ANGAN
MGYVISVRILAYQNSRSPAMLYREASENFIKLVF